MTYSELDGSNGGTIGRYTTDADCAAECGFQFSSKRAVVWVDDKPYLEGLAPAHVVTVADYDAAMEAHLKAEQVARGYTTRSPNEYANSTNTRWAQDAADWVAHVTAVMEYALEIENRHAAGETVPTLDEFKAALPRIQWTVAAS